MSRQIPEEAVSLLTSEPLIAHLATTRGNNPHVAPLWFNYSDDHIEIVTTGRKLANIRENPRVALSVQKDENGHPQWAVVLQGRGTIVEEEDEVRAATRRINRQYGVRDDAWSENKLVRIDIGSIDYWEY